MSAKKIAIGFLLTAAVDLVIGKHQHCDAETCGQLEHLRLAALAYALETLRAIAAKRVDDNRKPGQASKAAIDAVVEELRIALMIMSRERLERTGDHGATQAPGNA